MLYDIRDGDKAAATLERLTGVGSSLWSNEGTDNYFRIDFTDVDKDIEKIIKRYNGHYPRIADFEFVVTHVTTSSNECVSILNYGIVDLKKAYQTRDSELRLFLEEKGIEILLDSKCLKYKDNYYDISYEDYPEDSDSEEYVAWSVGRKFYFDFAVCGFLSINEKDTYGGYVHKRPEILWDLDNLLKTNLQNEWTKSHEAYEVAFKVPFGDIVFDDCDNYAEEYAVMSYLIDAYLCVCKGPDTKEIICKNGVEIYPEQILECKRFTKWH